MTATLPAIQLVTPSGIEITPDAARWFTDVDADDLVALDGLAEPVLDVGCGPGRIVAHLTTSGITALGVDVSREAVARARDRGAPVLHRSVFAPLPGLGRWGAAVLLDGNIGIGGDPAALLRRLHQLVRRGGRIVAEVAPPGIATHVTEARITWGHTSTPWFPWAVVGADGIGAEATAAGLCLSSVCRSNRRWFATLDRP